MFLPFAVRAAPAAIVLSALLTLPVSAQTADPELILHAYTLRHQPAAEALALVHPLLSERGSVQLQPGGNTLAVRDTAPVVQRVARLLREFDHPARTLVLRIQVVRAGDNGEQMAGGELEPELARRLQELLRYESYRVVAAAALEAREGERVSYELGDEYRIGFQVGTLMAGQRLKLRGFEVSGLAAADADPRPLLRTHVNLQLNKSMILGLTQNESSRRALLLVLTCTLGGGRP